MGAPIYLVSACTSGEEFIAAFRRYADKNGLFIPIGEPLPPGSRSRFAITLRDGGVMIEGEAEIVSSARSPSVLHGRVGMTLRFVTPDEASKITLGELERARLAMKPPPPSVPPRPAAVPAEPRPVPPPAQGRIDAMNALAECVAIGDTAALGAPLPSLPAPPPKAGPRFVAPIPAPPARSGAGTSPPGSLGAIPPTSAGTIPPASAGTIPPASAGTIPPTSAGTIPPASAGTIPPASAGTIPPASAGTIPPASVGTTPPARVGTPPPASAGTGSTGVATGRTSAMRGSTSPLSMVMPRTTDGAELSRRDAAAPASAPRATPRIEGLRAPDGRSGHDGSAGLSQTLVTAAPGPVSETMVAVAPPPPPPGIAPPPASTPAATGPIPRTSVTAATPRAAVPAIPRVTSSSATPRAAMPAPARTATRPGAAPTERLVSGPSSATLSAVPAPITLPPSAPTQVGGAVLATTDEDVSARTQIHAGVPAPPLSATASSALSASSVTSHGMPTVLRPPAQVFGDVEIAEPTDISLPPGPPAALSSDTLEQAVPDADPPAPDRRTGALRDGAPARSGPFVRVPDDGDGGQRPRHTVIGMAITPTGAPVLPARPAPAMPGASRIAADETTGEGPVDPVGPTLPPDARHAALDEPTPIVGWAMDGAEPPASPPPPPAMHPGAAHGLPNGDWTIALDPAAPDGWSAPQPPPLRADGTGRVSDSHAIAGGDHAAESALPRPGPGELPAAEPKVQIDPTLIEAMPLTSPEDLAPAAPAYAAPVAPALPMYGAAAAPGGTNPPPFPMLTMPPPGAFAPAQGGPLHPGQGGYPLDPGYLAMPMAMQPRELMAPHGGFVDPQYIDATMAAMRVAQRRRRLIIVLASALIAVLVGIGGLLVIRTRAGAMQITPHAATADDPAPTRAAPSPARPAGVGDPASSGAAPSAAPTATTASPTAPAGGAAPASPPGGAADPSPPAADPGSAAATVPPAAEPSAAPATARARNCFADVRSQPSGADILVGRNRVLGTTPKRVALPCGAPVDLVIRKGRLGPVTRAVTPTPDAPLVEVALSRQSFLVKVSSTPSGATITLGGKSLGVTPTIVRVPAFEASILSISKDGYELETERVAPRSNGLVIHSVLKRADRRKAR